MIGNEPHYLVYDDDYTGGEAWLSPLAFYTRSKQIVCDLIRHGYYFDDEDDENTDNGDIPTGT